jgi:AraC family transcriptional regulator
MPVASQSKHNPSRPGNDLAYRSRINLIIRYIQDHLEEPLDLETLASVAGFSPYHSHRIFTAFVGETIGEYIRGLRLGKSIQQLLNTSTTITEIALNSGYQTPAAYSKAFRLAFHVSPSQLRRTGLQIEDLPSPVNPLKQRKRRVHMEFEIKTMPERKVLSVLRKGLIENNFNQAADQAFDSLCAFIDRNHLWDKVQECLGITPDDLSLTPPEENRYFAGFFLKPGVQVQVGEEVKLLTLPGGRFVVFTHRGPYETMWQTWNAAYRDWLPTSGEELRDAMPFEIYLNDKHKIAPDNLVTEIYIPIK